MIAGALAFCQAAPVDPNCNARPPIVAADVTPAQSAALAALARDVAHGYDGQSEYRRGRRFGAPRDHWRIDAGGDCEDRILAALARLRATDAALYAAATPILFLMGREGRDRYAHVALLIETAGGPLVIDPEFAGRIVPLDRYRTIPAFTPDGDIRRWTPYPRSRD